MFKNIVSYLRENIFFFIFVAFNINIMICQDQYNIKAKLFDDYKIFSSTFAKLEIDFPQVY